MKTTQVIHNLGDLLGAWWTAGESEPKPAPEPKRSTRVDVACRADRERARVGQMIPAMVTTFGEVRMAQRILTPETRKRSRSCHFQVCVRGAGE